MNKPITIAAISLLSLTGLAFTALAHEEDEEIQARLDQQRRVEQQRLQQATYEQRGEPSDDRRVYEQRPGADDHQVFQGRQGGRQDGLGRLQRDVDHLNRMMNSVGAKMGAYGASRRARAQYEHLRAEARQLNNQFQRGEQYYNRSRIRSQIAHMHDELHQIEQNLRFRQADIYQWR